MLGNFFYDFFSTSTVFFLPNFTFSKNSFMITVSNRLDQDQTHHYVGPTLDSNCLQKYKHTTAAFYQGV